MTDQERASAFVGAQVEALDGFDVQQEINTLAEEFGAVRLDERRAIVAFLRTFAAAWPSHQGNKAVINCARAIENGSHGS